MKLFLSLPILFSISFSGCLYLNDFSSMSQFSSPIDSINEPFIEAVKSSEEGKKLISLYGEGNLFYQVSSAADFYCLGILTKAEANEKVKKDFEECQKKYAGWKEVSVEDKGTDSLVYKTFILDNEKKIVEVIAEKYN